jgi:hypothetical protein
MKSDLMLKKFTGTYVSGTASEKEFRHVFGSKMVEVEDIITIDDTSIQYSDVVTDDNNNGFQDYQYNSSEQIQISNLYTLKENYSSISLQSQSDLDKINNTKWILKINAKKILQDYLFYKLKESRTFRCIYYEDLYGYNVNTFIRKYIDENILNRYQFDSTKLYIKYINLLTESDIYSNIKLKYNPIFSRSANSSEYIIKNANIGEIDNIIYLDNLEVYYNQTKKSTEYKFDYYFDIVYKKI